MENVFNVNTEFGMFLHVALAAALAGLIGIERELSNKPAGFRTHLLIGGASALLIFLGRVLIESYEDSGLMHTIQSDPLRVLQAIIVGISFIGAGTILKSEQKNVVYFLTTAASTLFSSCIGITVALEKYILAVSLTFFVLIVTFLLGKLDRLIDKFRSDK